MKDSVPHNHETMHVMFEMQFCNYWPRRAKSLINARVCKCMSTYINLCVSVSMSVGVFGCVGWWS